MPIDRNFNKNKWKEDEQCSRNEDKEKQDRVGTFVNVLEVPNIFLPTLSSYCR